MENKKEFISMEQQRELEQAAENILRAEQMQAAQMKAETDAIMNSECVSRAVAVMRKRAAKAKEEESQNGLKD